MRRSLALVVLLGLAAPAYAGGDGAKCDKGLATCLKEKAALIKERGWVGIEMDEDKATGAVSIKKVVAESPAEKAGLKAGDVILAVNGVEYGKKMDEAAYKAAYKDWKPGSTAQYRVQRAGTSVDVAVVLGTPPEEVMAQWIGYYAMELLKAEEQVAQANP
jgi:S1-C subfamily serine protease